MIVNDLLNRLYKSTDSALIETQLASIPVVYELQPYNMPDILELRHQLRRSNSYKIVQRNGIIRHDQLQETTFLSSEDLYIDGIARKIICIDEHGIMVNTDTISIICDERSLYINSNDPYARLEYCIVFMTDVEYNRDNVLFSIYSNGTFSMHPYDKMRYISCSDLVVERIELENEYIEPVKIDARHKLFPENIFVFKNGHFMGNIAKRVTGNLFSVESYDGNEVWFAIIIYKQDDACIDHINKLQSKINLLELLSDHIPEYIDKLQDQFDYQLDNTKSYEENLKDILEYISNYSHDGLMELFLENNTSIIEEYTGEELLNKKRNGNFYISRRRKNKMYSHIIVYVNGLLYEYHDRIEYGIMNIGIPVIDINPDDEILVQFFLDCNNMESEIVFQEGVDNTLNYNTFGASPDNIVFYSPEFEGKHLYDLPVADNRSLLVDYMYDIDNTGNMLIELDNPYLYGKPLKVMSKRQFRYHVEKIPIKHQGQLLSEVIDNTDKITSFKNHRPNNMGEFNSLFDGMNPIDSISIDNISFSNNRLDDTFLLPFPENMLIRNFSWILKGYIWIDSDDEYTFNIISNNGSKLVIDDILVTMDIKGQFEVDTFDTSTNVGSIYLERGYHSFQLNMTNHSDLNKLALAWKYGDMEYELIPSTVLYKDLPEYHILPLDQTQFKYCLQHGHYIMFYNRRRLYDNESYVRVHGIDQVYDQAYIFISKPLPEGSLIDIFYVPDMVQEVYRSNLLPEHGYITVDKDVLLNTAHQELCGVFVNGKLINPKNIANLNTDTLKIKTNINTLGAVSVLKYNLYDGLAETLLEESNDVWTEITNTIPKDILDQYIGDVEQITDDEPDYFKPECVDLIWAIVKKFWIDRFGLIDAEELFQYNDDHRILRKSKTRHITIESSDYTIDGNTSYTYREDGYNKYHKFTCINQGDIYFGKFENLDIQKEYSLSVSVSMYLNLNGTQERFYCELYDNDGNTKQIPLWYNSEPSLNISDIPKCYCVRLYLNNIPITDTMNNIRLVCKLETPKEYIRFKNGVFLEEGNIAIRNIECIPIDPEIITGVNLPYSREFDLEKK